MKAVIVTAALRPRMKGDTMEYNTERVHMRPNANVEELLGRLPGLQIDVDGNITFNGEKIQHLLVDGEDIFGNSPTMVTRNFDGSKIARVQLLDRKSDRAQFTGVDDGTRTKTLNLIMKESAKDGYFGKVEAGGNTEGNYNANAVLAAFRNREQFTALGLAANTGALSFTNNSGGGSSRVGFQGATADPLGASAGIGIPQFAGTALHYANTWNGTTDHLASNYQYSHFFTRPLTTIQSVQTEPGTSYLQTQQNQSVNQQDQHWLYGVYDWAPSTKTAFKLTVSGSNSKSQNQFASAGSGSFGDTLTNSSQRTIQDKVTQQNIDMEVFWKRVIGRPERDLSAGVSVNRVDNNTNGFLYSISKFYQSNGSIQTLDTTDQRKQVTSHPISLAGNLYYTEPLWKGAFLAASYGVTILTDKPVQNTYNRGDGKYQLLVDSLSSHLQTQVITEIGLINLQGRSKRWMYAVGVDLLDYRYKQKIFQTDSTLGQQYFKWAPRMAVTYSKNPATSFKFYFGTFTQQPSISQLQNVKNNNDPLHIILGNPNLRPATNQNFRLDFHRLTTWTINLGAGISLIRKSITTKTITDSVGRQISQPLNVDGGHAVNVDFYVSRKVWGLALGIYGSGNYSRAVNYVNADLSRNDSYTGNGGISFYKNVPDKYILQLNSNISYFDQMSSINTAAPVRYWTRSHSGAITLLFLRNYEINTNATYTWQEKTSAFGANTSVFLLNGHISRNFLLNRLVVKAQINNVLNQNAGISRTTTNNTNTQTSTNILGRYWMLSVIYHFDRKFKH